MAERKTKIMFNGRYVDGYDVPIKDSKEQWSEFTMEDGTIIRAKVNIVSATRIDGVYDAMGNPTYQVNAAPVIGVVYIEEALRKKVQ